MPPMRTNTCVASRMAGSEQEKSRLYENRVLFDDRHEQPEGYSTPTSPLMRPDLFVLAYIEHASSVRGRYSVMYQIAGFDTR